MTLRVNRFTPRPERGRERGGSPFARKSSPFGDSGSARRRPRGKQWVQDYAVPARPEDTVLDCLLKVKRTIDPTTCLPLFVRSWHVRFRCRVHQRHAYASVHRHGEGLGKAAVRRTGG